MPEELFERAHQDSPWSWPDVMARTLPSPADSSTRALKAGEEISTCSTKQWAREHTGQVIPGVRVVQKTLGCWVWLIVVVTCRRKRGQNLAVLELHTASEV
jgi:hypothetical protein